MLPELSLEALSSRVLALMHEHARAPSVYEFKRGTKSIFVYKRGDSFVYHAPASSSGTSDGELLRFVGGVFRGIVAGGAPDAEQQKQAVVVII
jgi:hypothetical protein